MCLHFAAILSRRDIQSLLGDLTFSLQVRLVARGYPEGTQNSVNLGLQTISCVSSVSCSEYSELELKYQSTAIDQSRPRHSTSCSREYLVGLDRCSRGVSCNPCSGLDLPRR
jgi:hypothetical protein